MTTLLQRWKNRLAAYLEQGRGAHAETEASLETELLIPVSQLYGFEYLPAIERYREK